MAHSFGVCAGAAGSEMAVLVDDLTAAYNEFRFGGKRDAAPRMLRMLDRLDSSPHRKPRR